MTEGIVVCLCFGGLFWYLAIRQYQRSAPWRRAVPLVAVVKAVQYREAWERKVEINDHKSSAEATLCFSDLGRVYERRRQYPGILHAPVQGQKIPILFDRDSGGWIPRREARSHWCVFLAAGCFCTLAGLILLLGGRRILADLASYRVEAPNFAGSAVCVLVGLVCGACAYACIRGLMPDLLQTAADPFLWMVRHYVLHRYEEVNAQCIGIIRRESGDDDISYYPFFQYSVQSEPLYWFPKRQMSRKKYGPGSQYTLYRDPGTGKCTLKPTGGDVLSALLSLVPLGFFVILVLSLAACMVGGLYVGGIGFLYGLTA